MSESYKPKVVRARLKTGDGTERKREADWTWFYRARFSKHY